MAGDSRITGEHTIYDGRSTPKVIERGDYLIGISGDSNAGDILTYMWRPPQVTKEPLQQMGAVVVPSVRSSFIKAEIPIASKKSEYRYLISFDSTMFYLDSDLAFYQDAVNIYTLGSGGDIAKGFLYSQKESIFKNPNVAKKAAVAAIVAASKFDFYTQPPVTVMIQGE
jgi:ATP-dependent protease HslVU (ClpYQ) peptidase subunit